MKNRLRMHWRVVLGFCSCSLWFALPDAYAQSGNFNFNYPGPYTIIATCTNVLAGNMGTPTVSSNIGATITQSAFDPDSSHFQLTDSWNHSEVAHVYWKVADNMGSIAYFDFYIAFTDTTHPVINTGGLLPVVHYPSISQVPAAPVLTATDSCPPPPTVTFTQTTPPLLCQSGSFTRTWLATDLVGNTAVFTQTIIIDPDNSPPTVLTAPQNGSASCTQAATAYPAWVAAQMANFKASDPSGVASYSNNAPAMLTGSCPAPVTVTFQATDSCGFSVTRTATFTSVDNSGPYTVTAPKDSIAYCTVPANNYTAALAKWINRRAGLVARDSCTPDALLAYSMKINNVPSDSGQVVAAFMASYNQGCSAQLIGSQLYQKVHGVVRVDFLASDACGNTSLIGHADFGAIDTIPPTVSGANITEECGGSSDSTALKNWINNHGNATAADICSTFTWTNFTWTTSTGATGTGQFNSGPYPAIPANTCNWYVDVSFRATDECGNTGSATLRFGITDQTAPVFSGLKPLDTLYCPNTTLPVPTTKVTDNCDASVTITSNFQVINPVCSDAYSMLVTWIATDDCGNTQTATQTFVVLDTTKPVITLLPPTVTIRCDTFSLPAAPVLGVGLTATDVCGDVTGLSFADVSNQNPNPSVCAHYTYTIVRTFTVSDDCGNTSTGQQLIQVVDNIPPAFTGFTDTTLICAVPQALPAAPQVSDICSGIATPATLSSDVINGGPCSDSYTHTLTWSSTDVCGNTGTFIQEVMIADTVKPALEGIPGDVTVECTAIPAQPAASSLIGSDNCDETVDILFTESVIRDPNPANCAYWTNYMVVRQWTVQDNCGNSRVYTQIIAIQDDTGPQLIAQDTVSMPAEPGVCGATTVVPGLISVFDECTASKSNIILRDTVGFTASGTPVFETPVDTVVFSWSSPNLPPATPAVGNATLAIALDNADSKVLSETFEIWGEDGYHIGRTKLVNGVCGSSGDTTFTLPATLLNQWLTDGQLNIILSPNGSGSDACNAVCPGNRARATLSYSVSNQQVPLTVTCTIDNGPAMSYPPGNSFFLNAGFHVVKYTATDCAGNSSTASTIIRIQDLEPPLVTAPGPITGYVRDTNCLSTVVLPFPVLSENCSFSGNFNGASPVVAVPFRVETNSLQIVPKDMTLSISGLIPNAVSGGFLKIRHLGDNGSAGEFFNVYDEQNGFLSTTSTDTLGECALVHESTISVTASQINAWAAGDNLASFQLKPNVSSFNDFINNCQPLNSNDFDGISTIQAVLSYNYAIVNYKVKRGNTDILSGQLSDNQTKVTLPPGSYTVQYQVSDLSGNIGTTTFPLTVLDTVAPKAKCLPLITIFTSLSGSMVPYTLTPQELNNGSMDNCSGTNLSFQLSQSVFNCGMATPPNNLYPVTLTVTDTSNNSSTCTSTVQVRTVNFQPTVSQGICEGGMVQFFANPPQPTTGQTYMWTGPDGFISFLQNPFINNASAAKEGTYVIKVTGPTGCTTVATVDLDLSNLPGQPQFTAQVPSLICQGENLSLQCMPFGGSSVVYFWYSGTPSNSTLLGSGPDPLFLVTTPTVGVHQYFVKVSASGCTSLPSVVKDITVQQRPLAIITQKLISICPCEPIQLNATPQSGQNIMYQWSGPNFTGSGLTPLVTSCAASTNAGAYELTVFANGCPSAPDTAMVTVRNKPPKPEITGITKVCQGSSIYLLCPNIPTAAQYLWTSPQGNVIPTDTNFILINGASIPLHAGFWRLRILQDNCYSDNSDPKLVEIQAAPNVTATSDAPVCQGHPLHLSAASTSTDTTYFTWSGPNGFNMNGPMPTDMTPATGTYTVTVSTGFQCTNTAEVSVTVVPPPVINSVTNNAPVCTDCATDAVLQASVFPASGNLVYKWYFKGNLFSTEASPTIPKVCLDDIGTYILVVENANGCLSNQGSTEINVQPEPPTPSLLPQGMLSRCVDSIILISIDKASQYGSNISFEWHTPYGTFTQAQAEINIPMAGLQHSGDYWVVAKSGDCGSAPSNIVHVTVNGIPPAPVASSNSPVCEGDTLKLFASTVVGPTTNYKWEGPGGFTATTQDPYTSQVSSLSSGTYRVQAIVNGCASPFGTTQVEVKPRPGKPVIDSILPVCLSTPGAALTMKITDGSATQMAQYTWFNAQTLNQLGPPDFALTFVLNNLSGLSPGINRFFAKATLNGCVSPASDEKMVRMDTIPKFLAYAGEYFPACDVAPFRLHGNYLQNSNVTGHWSSLDTFPHNIIEPGSDSTLITDVVAGNNYCFAWTLSNGACMNYSTDTVCVSVNKFEEAKVDTSSIFTCFADSIQLNAIQGKTVPGFWTQPPGQIPLHIEIVNLIDTHTIVRNLQPNGVHDFFWNLQIAGCPLSSAKVTIYNIFKNADAGPDTSVCSLDPCARLLATPPNSFERGKWFSLDPPPLQEILSPGDPNSKVCKLHIGENHFLWVTNGGLCDDRSRDTAIVFYDLAPMANPDSILVAFGRQVTINALQNDVVPTFATVEVIRGTQNGTWAETSTPGTFTYLPDLTFSGTDELVYELCNVNKKCDCTNATIKFIVGKADTCRIPNIITPNGDGANDFFVIPPECLTNGDGEPGDNEVTIFNQWGDQVYHKINYDNKWDGRYDDKEPLPSGTYYYVVRLPGYKPQAGFLILQR